MNNGRAHLLYAHHARENFTPINFRAIEICTYHEAQSASRISGEYSPISESGGAATAETPLLACHGFVNPTYIMRILQRAQRQAGCRMIECCLPVANKSLPRTSPEPGSAIRVNGTERNGNRTELGQVFVDQTAMLARASQEARVDSRG